MTLPEAAGLALAFIARLITGAQGHWHGSTPKAEQRIYFANHQSHFDWVLIWAALPHDLRAVTRPIAARDYWTATPLKHWITREIFNAVYVSRQRAADGSVPVWLGWGLGCFALGWVIQFIGHWYEGRKPAFVDDVIGLVVAPMFIVAEAMFMLGWNKPLLSEIERRAGPTTMRDMARIA